MKKLAIIGAGPMATIFAEHARAMGVETHCFAWAQGASAKEDVDVFHDVSVIEVDEIARICKEEGIAGVVPTTELTVYPAAYVAHALGLNGNDPAVARVITNKFRNREASKNVPGLNHPAYWLVKCADDALDLDLEFPVVVKPTSEGGKRGVTVVYDQAGLEAALGYAADEKKDASDIVIEGFLPEGMECSVESLSFHGEHRIIQVTEKWSSGAPHCVELGHHQPANLDAATRQAVERAVTGGLAAIGIENGPCHTEVKICDGKVYLIEFNARPGGDHISYPLTGLSTGYPYITGIIECALDELELPSPDQFEHAFAGICFVTEQTKELKAVFDTCQDQAWCYEKNEVTNELGELAHNRGYDTNYFIYYSTEERPAFLEGLL